MEKSARIAIAKQIMELIDNDTPFFGEESWEADIGRFIDKERFEIEKKKLFLERPQLIALTGDLPNPGDYFATDIAGKPILIVRNKEGKAQAFLNACRHRGVKLAEEGCGHGKGFVCPYHGWTFNNDGELISVPSRSAFEPSQLRNLVALPTAEDIGVIVVHPDPEGHLDLDAFLGDMKGLLEDLHIDECEQIAQYRAPARINWKHAVDGGMEAYHTPFLHPTTFMTDGGGFLPVMELGDHHALITSGPQIKALKEIPEAEWPHDCGFGSVNAIFPNTVIGGGPLQPVLFFQRTEPMTEPGECHYNFRLYGPKNGTPEQKEAARKAIDLFMKVSLEEDLPAQTSCQLMMEAGAVPSVLFGKRESSLTGMHKNYDAAIGHDAAAALRSNSKAMGVR
jgi:nitrite reductase/ring-hydroxylating ferredoxin subunit